MNNKNSKNKKEYKEYQLSLELNSFEFIYILDGIVLIIGGKMFTVQESTQVNPNPSLIT